MRKYLPFALATLLIGGLAYAQVVPQPGPPTPIACAYNTSPVTLTNGQAGWVQCAANGSITTTPSGTGTQQVVGNVASGVADSGNPVKVGAQFITTGTQPTFATGNRADLQVGSRGSLRVQLMVPDASGNVLYQGINSDAVAAFATPGAATVGAITYVYNGTTFDRQRGSAAEGTITKPYAFTASAWSYAAAASGIVNTTTAVTIKAAAGANMRNYITAIQIMSEALTNATEFAIRDGAGGTVLWRTKIGTGGLTNGISMTFPVPLVGTANTLLEIVTLTASGAGAVYFNAQGYVGS